VDVLLAKLPWWLAISVNSSVTAMSRSDGLIESSEVNEDRRVVLSPEHVREKTLSEKRDGESGSPVDGSLASSHTLILDSLDELLHGIPWTTIAMRH
jgi:hypothetical protein